MTDSSYPARCAEQSSPGRNYHLGRTWTGDLVVGPDAPQEPAHSFTWHPDVIERRQDALRRARPAWRAAEAAFERLVGGDRETGLHQRRDRA